MSDGVVEYHVRLQTRAVARMVGWVPGGMNSGCVPQHGVRHGICLLPRAWQASLQAHDGTATMSEIKGFFRQNAG